MRMQVRDVPGEERKILNLFNIVYGRKLDLEFWNWRMVENPYGTGIIRLMFDEEKLVGHYSAIPQPLWLDGTVIESALLMTAMTHPDYRGKKICTNLAKEVYDACKARGLRIVFGFPNDNIYQLYVEHLGWVGFGHMYYWEKADLAWQDAESQREYAVEEIANFDSRFDDLWHRAEGDYKVAVPRVSKYLNWRYFAKPGKEYQIYSIEDENLLCGYAVLKLFRENGEATGHIVDALVVDKPEAYWSLLAQINDFFKKRGASRITCWFQDNSVIAGVLRQAGFERRTWPTYFGARVLGLDGERTKLVSECNNWWITMGDSDVF